MQPLCSRAHTLGPVLYRMLLWALSESGMPELFTHTSVSILPAQKRARWSAVFGDACFTARTVVSETPWGWVPKQLRLSLSDRAVQMSGSAAVPALLWRGNKPNWTVRIHNIRSTEKSQNPFWKGFPRSRFLQTCRFPWSKLYVHKVWPMLSVLNPSVHKEHDQTLATTESQNVWGWEEPLEMI